MQSNSRSVKEATSERANPSFVLQGKIETSKQKSFFSLTIQREIINKVNNMGMGTENCQSRIFYKSTHFPCLRQGIIV